MTFSRPLYRSRTKSTRGTFRHVPARNGKKENRGRRATPDPALWTSRTLDLTSPSRPRA
ncbi:MAG: hypothetical protein BLITH_1125 [Brockia lithotrophica]|uniref:Uncharacterized protein n=1 Tax=Brockia lithotrophica TaxID=933949 RepID=A0A2T5G7M7_9BACL|nr:MAG: hypothetical protein BLITH_1125 [Brockia lithotrophica]